MVHSDEKVHFAEEPKKEDTCVVDITHANFLKSSSNMPPSTAVSSGQTTPWAGSQSALLGKGPGPADSGPMEDVLLGNVAAAYRSPKDERTPFERIKHFYYKYIVVLNGVTMALAVVLFILLCILISLYYQIYHERTGAPRSVIFMLADGFGPASQTLARAVHMSKLPPHIQEQFLPGLAPLALDDILRGTIRTSSRNSLVTDSAAGATAYACGRKSNNGVYGASNKRHYATLLEAAKYRGMTTGVVVTSSITHATPAAFTAHGLNRENENKIAEWQMSGAPFEETGKPVVDLYFGGGLCRYLPMGVSQSGTLSCRQDSINLLDQARSKFGYNVMTTRSEFDNLSGKSSLPVLGLFAREHMSYEIERDPLVEPSLSEMLKKTLDIFEPYHSKQGFFLFVEGSRIDMAAHENDAPTHAFEAIEYNRAVQHVKDFVKKHPDTLLVSVADHETGGLSLGRKNEPNYWIYAYPYRYMPLSFDNIHKSAFMISKGLIQEAIRLGLHSKNAFSWSKASAKAKLIDIIRKTIVQVYHAEPIDITLEKAYFIVTMHDDAPYPDENVFRAARVIGEAIAIKAGLSWSTPGHTGVDINLYAMGAGVSMLNSSMENTDVHYVVKDLLKLDTDAVSERLQRYLPKADRPEKEYSGSLGGS